MTPTSRPHRFIAFGELLMRLDPRGHERFVQAGEFQVRYTGGEANAAALLTALGSAISIVDTMNVMPSTGFIPETNM